MKVKLVKMEMEMTAEAKLEAQRGGGEVLRSACSWHLYRQRAVCRRTWPNL